MDYLAVADAIAARFATGVTPPTVNGVQQQNIQLATARPPNGLRQSPNVVVFADHGEWVWMSGRVYTPESQPARYIVNFYYAKHEADLPREWAALQAWLGVLRDRLQGQAQLGLGSVAGVTKALPMDWKIGALSYAGTMYDGITITVGVWTDEVAPLTP